MRFYFDNNSDKKWFELLFQTHKNNLEYLSYIRLIENDNKLENNLYDFSINNEIDTFKIKKLFINQLLKQYSTENAFILASLLWDTHLISVEEYSENAYLKTFEGFLQKEKIPAFRLFNNGEKYAYGEKMVLKLDYGFFRNDFNCPTITFRNNQKLFVTPLDIKMSKIPLQIAKGKVLIVGLKLGYFAYTASLKEDINEIYVVESDPELISFFKSKLLPLFPKNKNIHVLQADALEYLENIQDRQYDFIYVDLWDETEKGIELYLAVQKLFSNFRITKRVCYLENDIITQLRLLVIDVLIDVYEHKNEIYYGIKKSIYQSLEDITLSNSYELDALLCIKGLRKLLLTK